MMKRKGGAAGYVLLEALVGLLIFSLGLLGLIGFQAASTKIASDSRFRTEAALLADELIARMSAAEISTVKTQFASPDGSGFKAWLDNRVKGGSHLPNPVVTLSFQTAATSSTLLANIHIEWTVPGSTTANKGREVTGIYETRALLF